MPPQERRDEICVYVTNGFYTINSLTEQQLNASAMTVYETRCLFCPSRVSSHCKIGLTENAGNEIAEHEFAIHDKYRMKIYYITVQCAFLLNFKSFVCTASVLTWKTELRLLIINIAPHHTNRKQLTTCRQSARRRQ